MAHIAGLVAAGAPSQPVPARRPRHDDHAQDAARAARRARLRDARTLGKQVDKTVFPGIQGGPLMHVIAAKAVALKLADTDEFRDDMQRTVENAKVLAATLAEHGAQVVSGGTDNHLMLVDVTPLGVTGKEAETLLDEVGITVNKNAIPFDPLPPNTASGIRVGTPATTTRGFGPAEMREVGRAHRRAPSPSSATTRRRRPAWRPRCATSAPLPGARPARGVSQAALSTRCPFILAALVAARPGQLPPDAAGHPLRRAAGRDRRARRRAARPQPAHPARRRPGRRGRVRGRRRASAIAGQRLAPLR